MNVSLKQVEDLFQSQLKNWELALINYKALRQVESKEFHFDKFKIKVQFNPARIQSSAAKVDTKSIQERKCFLCPKNLPEIQQGIPFGGKYQILVNPYPIFPVHFTIPTYEHVDQLIKDRYIDMLNLAKKLNEFVIFYNGPKCGASAPDHAHFQAGIKGFLPIENEIDNISKEKIYESEGLTVFAIKDYYRNGFLLEAYNENSATIFFNHLYSFLELKDGEKEPMMNILSWFDNEKWYSCIFPREKHRPSCYFAEGEDNLLISPASVDLGGVITAPLVKDFNKISRKDVIKILDEICISEEKMQSIINKIKEL